MKAICPLAQIPVRLDPNDRSEMVTQVLFGETFDILEEKGNWQMIRLHLDHYEGWIDRKQSLKVGEVFIDHYNHHAKHIVTDKTVTCTCKKDGTIILLGKGSCLPDYTDNTFHLGEKHFTIKGRSKLIPKKYNSSKIPGTAIDYLNTPYLWGGRSIFGVDCSGFVQMVYHICGIDLPRNAAQQALKGETIDFVDEVKPGDLAFFDNPAGKIIHVGIILETGKIIHASGRVKTDKIDHNGIFNIEMKEYTHSLRIIKRLKATI